jgi:hypothetical protein
VGKGTGYKNATKGAEEVADLMFKVHQDFYEEIGKYSGYN